MIVSLRTLVTRRRVLGALGASAAAGLAGACVVPTTSDSAAPAPPEGLAAMMIGGRRVLVDIRPEAHATAAGRLCAVIWPRTGEVRLAVVEEVRDRPARTGLVHAPDLDQRYPENARNWRSVTVLGPVVAEA